ncbi:conserved hypothetical protein [Ricinus communis]|uniref:Uncharacterized protein n=1 Tax=Ricinus communis TaxID=3988 RepID=B9SW74_RICCO|nr:conserved hypothetical protein [Ricinus communis]
MPMDKASLTFHEGKKASLPPKRGQINAQIFESFTKTIVSIIFSLAGEALKLKRGSREEDGGDSSSSSSSDGVTPPFRSHNSDDTVFSYIMGAASRQETGKLFITIGRSWAIFGFVISVRVVSSWLCDGYEF